MSPRGHDGATLRAQIMAPTPGDEAIFEATCGCPDVGRGILSMACGLPAINQSDGQSDAPFLGPFLSINMHKSRSTRRQTQDLV
jgi:hypothetical protein